MLSYFYHLFKKIENLLLKLENQLNHILKCQVEKKIQAKQKKIILNKNKRRKNKNKENIKLKIRYIMFDIDNF